MKFSELVCLIRDYEDGFLWLRMSFDVADWDNAE